MEVDKMVDDRPKAKGKKKNNDVWIREEADDIVDFTDVSTAKKISGESPKFYAVLKFFHENLFGRWMQWMLHTCSSFKKAAN